MSNKHKYRSDYEVHETQLPGRDKPKYKKELKYIGKYYIRLTNEPEFKAISKLSILCMLLIAGIFLGLGYLNNQGSRLIYVILPYIIMFLPIYYGIMGSLKMLRVKERMTVLEYERSSVRIKKSSLSLTVMAIATAMGEGIFLLRNLDQQSKIATDYFFFAGVIIILILSLLSLRLQAKVKVKEEE